MFSTDLSIHGYSLILKDHLLNSEVFGPKPLAVVQVYISILRIFSTRAEDHAENS